MVAPNSPMDKHQGKKKRRSSGLAKEVWLTGMSAPSFSRRVL